MLHFLHGWGFDADFWRPLAALLPEWSAVFDDRGYFGAPATPAAAGPCIVIAHSLGAMRAISAPRRECRGLVAINGFDRFTGSGERAGVSPRIVDRMIARFDSDPAAVLTDFHRRIGSEDPAKPADIDRLREDLLTLRDGDCTAASASWPVPLLSLQGAQDPLLPSPMRDLVFAGAPLLERTTSPSGGHLLPITEAPFCAQAIRTFAERTA